MGTKVVVVVQGITSRWRGYMGLECRLPCCMQRGTALKFNKWDIPGIEIYPCKICTRH